MNQIEESLLNLILEKLPLIDLVRFRRVNREWKRLIDAILSKQKELILFFQRAPVPSYYWSHNDQRINPDSCLPSNWKIYLSEWVQHQFREVTSLMLVVASPFETSILEEFNFLSFISNREPADLNSFIGHFEQLRHLQIVFLFSSWDRDYKCRIRSRHLQTFHLEGNVLRIAHAFQIESLVCENLTEFSTVTHLDMSSCSLGSKLKYLSCKSLHYKAGQVRFRSLEILILEDQQKAIDLDDFPELKKLHFNAVEERFYSEVFVDVFTQKSLRKNPLKIFLLGVQFAFERWQFGSEQSYLATIRELYSRLMALERRTNFEPTWLISLANLGKELLFFADLRIKFPRATIDVQYLNFCIRSAEDFESNRIKRTLLYSDSLGRTLDALKRDSPNDYENLAKCVHKVGFLEAITDRKTLENLKDFFQWVYMVGFREFDQELLDLLPTLFPHLDSLLVQRLRQKKASTPIDCAFLSKLAYLKYFRISTKNSVCVQDLRTIFTNCKYLSNCWFKIVKFRKLNLREGGWRLAKMRPGTFLCSFYKDFPDQMALLEYLESHPESFPTF